MTREQLDAIRARLDEVPFLPFEATLVFQLCANVRALLDEVERLRDAHAMVVQVSGELCEKCGWAMKFPEEPCRCELLAEVARLTAEVEAKVAQNVALIGQNGRLQLEVERLTAERDTAFSRGVAAMREALLQRFDWHGDVADRIRAEPVPEDKP